MSPDIKCNMRTSPVDICTKQAIYGVAGPGGTRLVCPGHLLAKVMQLLNRTESVTVRLVGVQDG